MARIVRRNDSAPKILATACRSHLLAVALLCSSAAALGGCVLPPLEELESTGSVDTPGADASLGPDAFMGADAGVDASLSSDTSGGGGGGPSGEASDDFKAVAQTLRDNCAACHGASPLQAGNNNFSMPGGKESTDAEIWESLVGVDTTEGNPIVAAGDAASSALYVRLTLDPSDSEYMPSTGWSDPDGADAAIEAIRVWIDAGAEY